MDDSAREADPFATEKPDDEDEKDNNADVVNGRASKIRTPLNILHTSWQQGWGIQIRIGSGKDPDPEGSGHEKNRSPDQIRNSIFYPPF